MYRSDDAGASWTRITSDERPISPAALAQQHQLEQRLAELITRSSQLVTQAQSSTDQMAKLAPNQDALKAQLAAAAAKVKIVLSGPKATPMPRVPPGPPPATLSGVNGNLLALYKMTAVDAAPTAIQLTETDKAERELNELAATWDALKTAELAPLGVALTAAGFPAIRPELVDEPRQGQSDEE